MSNEPEYLRRIREAKARAAQKAPTGGRPDGADLTVQEQEAIKWAREVGGANLRSMKGVGARNMPCCIS